MLKQYNFVINSIQLESWNDFYVNYEYSETCLNWTVVVMIEW